MSDVADSLSANDWGGPYVCAACFCENVLVEKDGVTSAIRIVDRFFVPTNVPEGAIAIGSKTIKLYISLKSGQAKGNQKITIEVEAPSGLKSGKQEVTVFFEGADRGSSLIFETVIPTEQEGLYWYRISTESVVLTRMPMHVIFQPFQPLLGTLPG